MCELAAIAEVNHLTDGVHDIYPETRATGEHDGEEIFARVPSVSHLGQPRDVARPEELNVTEVFPALVQVDSRQHHDSA